MVITPTIMFFAAITVVTVVLSLLPRIVLEGVILVTSVLSIVTLLFGISMAFGLDPGIDWVNEIGEFKFIATGIVSCIIMSLFYQGMMNKD